MSGEQLGHNEMSCANNDLNTIKTPVGKMRIKQEVGDNSSHPSLPNPSTEDHCSRSQNLKVKQETSSKLTVLKNCLEINKSISLLLTAEIDKVRLAYKQNLEKQKVLQKILDENKTGVNDKPPSQVRAISVFAAPYFRDVRRMVPPNNEDTKIKLRNHDVNAYLKPSRPWTKGENKRLLDGVTGHALLSALKPYKIKRDFLKKKLKEEDLLEFEIEVIENQIASVQKKIKNISKKPLNELLEEVNGKIDWLNISAVNMEGEKTPDECENMWNNYLNFNINKGIFEFEENERLKNLAEDNLERDWDYIAESLKTNRTAIQCFERYRTCISGEFKRRFWTPEEDKKLSDLVEEHRYGKIIPWNKISLLMDGRTRQQVINRYERSVTPQYNRGPWTPEEDGLLIACYHKYGVHWGKMKDFFQKRSPCSLRERYVNSLDPSIKMGSWSKDEDRLLITLVRRYGYGKWAKICKHIPGRTDNMCLVRAGRLLEHSIRYHSENGTGEYDPGVKDPELFAKILRPLAPSKSCYARNIKLKSCRETAIDKLLIAIDSVIPEVIVKQEDDNSLDFSWLSYEHLQRISIELHNMLEERTKMSGPYVPRRKYLTKRPPIRKRLCEESDEEITQPTPEKYLPENERIWLTSVVKVMFEMGKKLISPGKKNLAEIYNTRETAEISLYKAYLYKQFHCVAKCDEDDDIENVIFSGVDFSETLQTVVSFFIQPPVYEGQFIVLSPNITTIGALDVIQVTENRLQCMSKHVSHSKNYLDFICERRKSCPKCLQCFYREQSITSSSTAKVQEFIKCAETASTNMKNDLFIVNDTMQEAIDVESAVLHTSMEMCSCAELEESKKSVQLLRQRFMALFLWPALLSATDLNKEQEDILIAPRKHAEKNYYWRANKPPVKRKYKLTYPNKKGKKKSGGNKKSSMPLKALEGDQNESNPSTSADFDARDSQLNNAAEKSLQKSNKTKTEKAAKRKIEQPLEGLRRSKRLAVLNRTSFSYSEITSKCAVSTDAVKECETENLTATDDHLRDDHLTNASDDYHMSSPEI